MSNYSSSISEYKVKNGVKYRISYRYIGKDGEVKKSNLRGFDNREEAQKWKQESLPNHIKVLESRPDDCFFIAKLNYDDIKKDNKQEFWTYEEYKKFSVAIEDEPLAYCAFEILFWTGICVSELLALDSSNIDFKNSFLCLNNKSKMKKRIPIPEDLIVRLKKCIDESRKVFPVSKYYLNRQMERGCLLSGVKKINACALRRSNQILMENARLSIIDAAWKKSHKKTDLTV